MKDLRKNWRQLGDVYVNDAFGTAHRAHASTAVIAKFFPGDKKMFGLLMEGEVKSAEKVLHQAGKPFVAIIGGAKVSDKMLILENLLERATDIIIGGGMAYTFMKAEGGNIGNSLCEDDRIRYSTRDFEKGRRQKEFAFICLLIPSLQINLMRRRRLLLHQAIIFPMDGWVWILGRMPVNSFPM